MSIQDEIKARKNNADEAAKNQRLQELAKAKAAIPNLITAVKEAAIETVVSIEQGRQPGGAWIIKTGIFRKKKCLKAGFYKGHTNGNLLYLFINVSEYDGEIIKGLESIGFCDISIIRGGFNQIYIDYKLPLDD